MSYEDRIAEYLREKVVPRLGPDHPAIHFPQRRLAFDQHVLTLPTAEDLARKIVADGEFLALRLGTWLRTPDGEVIAKAVSLVLPPPGLSVEFNLMVEALKLAAQLQHEAARQKVAGPLALTGLVGLVVVGAVALRRAA
ncbi:MAG TPA: hypothetical protein VGB83_02510 [Actinomycetota bacterium]